MSLKHLKTRGSQKNNSGKGTEKPTYVLKKNIGLAGKGRECGALYLKLLRNRFGAIPNLFLNRAIKWLESKNPVSEATW